MNKLWTTCVGSHVWKMNRPDSDIDLFEVYAVPTADILSGDITSGKTLGCGSQNRVGNCDIVVHDIGKVVDMVIGLRISENTLDTVHKVSKDVLSDVEKKFGLDLTKESTLLRLAIANLLSTPPDQEKCQNLVIACNDDNTFAKFLNNILEEAVPA